MAFPGHCRVSASERPLYGLRVLDLTTWWAGPLAGMILADLGADVIKIEAIQRLDNWRATLADFDNAVWWETSPLFNAVQRNKRGMTLNLTDPRGVELFKRLAAESDIVIENYSRRVMPQFGLSYETLKAVNPRLIMISQSGFGQEGPWADYISFANVAESLAGIAHLTGYPDGPPCISGQMLGDTLSGLHGATAILLAVQDRERSGEGCYIDLSQLEASLPAVAEALADHQMNGRTWARNGNRHPHMAPHGCYPSDEDECWLVIAIADDGQWQRLAEFIDSHPRHQQDSSWTRDRSWVEFSGRKAREDALDKQLADWTAGWQRAELLKGLGESGIHAAPVLKPSEVLTEPRLLARGFFQSVERAVVGSQPYPRSPIRFTKSSSDIYRPAPTLGEHSREVLHDILKLDQTTLDDLEREQIIGTVPAAVLANHE